MWEELTKSSSDLDWPGNFHFRTLCVMGRIDPEIPSQTLGLFLGSLELPELGTGDPAHGSYKVLLFPENGWGYQWSTFFSEMVTHLVPRDTISLLALWPWSRTWPCWAYFLITWKLQNFLNRAWCQERLHGILGHSISWWLSLRHLDPYPSFAP